jgi:ribonuclease BN (tRNA processing enzyme)
MASKRLIFALCAGFLFSPAAFAQPEQGLSTQAFSVMTLGTGSPRYSTVRSRPAALVSLGDLRILVDMGTGTENRLNEQGIGLNQINHLMITHHHIDHDAELPLFLVTASVRQSLESVTGPAGTRAYVSFLQDFYMEDMLYRTRRRNVGEDALRSIEVRDLQGGESFKIGDLKVTTAKVEHSIHTVAYRFDQPNQGSIVVSGDLTYSPGLVELSRGADILVIDSGGMPSAGNEQRRPRAANADRQGARNSSTRRRSRPDQAHGSLEDVATMASEAGVSTLVLTHIGVDRVDEALVRERISAIFDGAIEIASDGNRYPVSSSAPQENAAETSVPRGSYAIVDTGQVTCYDDEDAIRCPVAGAAFHGQDAQFSGNAPGYSDNSDGTVTDNVTGLVWRNTADTDGDGVIDAADKLSYEAAVAYCDKLSLAGHDDWQLPSIKQLYSLIIFNGTDPGGYRGSDTSGLTPFIDTGYFDFSYGDTDAGERIIDAQYATTTLYVGSTRQAQMFGVNFADGRIKGYPLSRRDSENTFFVACSRGNANYGRNDLTDNGDGTISDLATGLMWARDDSGSASPGGFNWKDALAHVAARNDANFLGYSDWRLPNVKELQSIVDYGRSPETAGSAAIDPLFDATPVANEAGQTDYAHYWSSTTHTNQSPHPGSAAAYVNFGRAMGNMRGNWVDIHGAGAQRSDPKAGDPESFPRGRGPQGDAIRIFNLVRLVRSDPSTEGPHTVD